jgi:phosphoribosylformylglycinamidine synthase
LGCSLYLREILGREDGPPPPVDLKAEKKNGDFVRGLITDGKVSACHDVSDGGLLVAIAEMTYRGGIGAHIEQAGDAAFWFGEDQARYVVAGDANVILAAAKKAGVPATVLGKTQAINLEVKSAFSIPVAELKAANEKWLPKFMT